MLVEDIAERVNPQPSASRGPRRMALLVGLIAVAAFVLVLVPGAPGPCLLCGADDGQSGSPESRQSPPTLPPAEFTPRAIGVQSHSVADVERFSRWLGRDVEVVVVYMDDDDWHDVVNPWFIGHDDPDMDLPGWVAADPAHRRLVVSQALAPEDEHDWRSRGAAGDYDEHWEAFARRLVNAGLGRSVIRLAWEMNGSWYASHYTGKSDEDLEHWKAYWRRAVQTMRGVEGADFLFEWSPNAGPSSSGLPFVDFYPGDDVVDVVGLDSYDFSVGTPRAPEQRWRHQWSQLNGVQDFVELAESHGKPMAFGEWAVVAPCDCNESNGIGDNPTYVSRMADVVRDHDFVYQAYFNVQDGGINMRLNDAPKSSGVYRARFGPLGDAVGS